MRNLVSSKSEKHNEIQQTRTRGLLSTERQMLMYYEQSPLTLYKFTLSLVRLFVTHVIRPYSGFEIRDIL